jgi:hypothetical protein
MNIRIPEQAPARPPVVVTLAHLLERLEHSPEPVDPAQYRSVVLHLVQEFESVKPGKTLDAVLDSYPSAAELYENLRYQHAGLCRSALEFSMSAEMQARDVIDKARRATDQR